MSWSHRTLLQWPVELLRWHLAVTESHFTFCWELENPLDRQWRGNSETDNIFFFPQFLSIFHYNYVHSYNRRIFKSPILYISFYFAVRPEIQTTNTILHSRICCFCVWQFVMCHVVTAPNYFHAVFSFPFLGALTKLRRVTIGFVMSVCLTVRPSVRTEQLSSHWTDFHDIWYFRFFFFAEKSVDEIEVSLQFDNNCTSHKVQCTRVGTLIVATIYLQLIKNKYMFRSFTVLQCSHQHCVQPVASDVEVVGYL